ncbi:urea ABC transporter permease subunit UrtB [Cognatishimia sp.]|uniref:urea ABC transporter permease subunit UrtB n=1 Tax=Cognatishimia sp. TaxID=2211648 RepID=UPI0035181D38|nr:urea ABC transporter permease subunit UrtB [Cognatishimia sp.]
MLRVLTLFLGLLLAVPAFAQSSLYDALAEQTAGLKKPSSKTIETVISSLQDSGAPGVADFLTKLQSKEVWYRKSDDKFFFVATDDKKTYRLIDIQSGEVVAEVAKKEIKQIKPNSGVRAKIDGALVAFRLTDADPAVRDAALVGISRDPKAKDLAPLSAALASETDPDLKARMERLSRVLTVSFGDTTEARVAAIASFDGDLGLDARAVLNPLVTTTLKAAPEVGAGENVAKTLRLGNDISEEDAFDLLVASGLAQAEPTKGDIKAALKANIIGDTVGGMNVANLGTDEARLAAHMALAASGAVPAILTSEDKAALLASAAYYEVYAEADPAVTAAAVEALSSISTAVGVSQFIDLVLDGISLASIYFLAAIGLAITFGVMRVINMAHGEFIMMGAYTGYVVQQIIPNYTVSLIVAIPAAFVITFAAGVAMERLVIRHLYHRPLETLLATFGISIALQQIAKNIFGTQARPLTSPGWLDGALVFNDVIAISWIRIAIFVLAVIFFLGLLFVLNRTRLGLETRAVTQNPRMAAAMGINPDRINMLTFGLGSGIAGIAGIAIGLFAKVTSELGSDYIVQSFMTVVVGGVGNIFGTLAGATMIGFLQKGIEWFNPSNTLAAQTYMIIFIIIFIQFRPRGIIALKGRAAGD